MVAQQTKYIDRSGTRGPDMPMCETKKKVLESVKYVGKVSSETDLQIARLVRNALSWSPFLEGMTLDVAATNGTVILGGSSPYESLGRIAAMIAYTIPGVLHVVDNIRIVPFSRP